MGEAMKRLVITGLLVAWAAADMRGQAPQAPAIYVRPVKDGFNSYLTLALLKKEVPATLVGQAEKATLTLKLAEDTASKGTSNGSRGDTWVLVDGTGRVVWSYTLSKGSGAKHWQTSADTIARRLKFEYFTANRR